MSGRTTTETVGRFQSTANGVSHMPPVKAQEHGASTVATAALSRGHRFANSNWPFLRGVFVSHPPSPASRFSLRIRRSTFTGPPWLSLLGTEVPGLLRALAILHGEEWFWRAERAHQFPVILATELLTNPLWKVSYLVQTDRTCPPPWYGQSRNAQGAGAGHGDHHGRVCDDHRQATLV